VLQGDGPAGGMQRGARSLVRTGCASERETEGRILPSPGSATPCGPGYRSDLATYHAIAGQPGRAPKHRAHICHLRAAWRSTYRGGSTRYCTPYAVFIPPPLPLSRPGGSIHVAATPIRRYVRRPVVPSQEFTCASDRSPSPDKPRR